MLTCVKFLGNSLSPFRDKTRQSLVLSQLYYLLLLPSYQNMLNSSSSLSTTKQNGYSVEVRTIDCHYHATPTQAAAKLKRPADTTHRQDGCGAASQTGTLILPAALSLVARSGQSHSYLFTTSF
jgi:hypothetical protein